MRSLLKEKTGFNTDKPKKLPFFSYGNYPYVCARVKAKRALLLSRDVYSKLLMMDAHEITRFLGESQYKKEINELAINYSGFELTDIALNKNISEVYSQILGYCEGDLYNMLSAYLQRDDIWNIKTIIRGKFYNAKSDEIIKTIKSAGKHTEDYWRKIIQESKNVEEVIDNLEDNEFYQILKELKEEYLNFFPECENKLEIAYYSCLLSSIRPNSEPKKLFLGFVKKEIDLLNLKTLLMTKFENVEPSKISTMIIPDGEISEKDMQRLVNISDFKQFLEEVQKLPYFKTISDEIKKIDETKSLNHVIRFLEKDFLEKATKSSYLYPLSIMPILDYFIRKRIEVENLRILVRGKEKGLSEQIISELLVM